MHRIIDRPLQPLAWAPGCPFASAFPRNPVCAFRFPFPRVLLAPQATGLRVAPPRRSFGCAGSRCPGCPVLRTSAPPSASSGCPVPASSPHLTRFRVAPVPASPACRRFRLRVAPPVVSFGVSVSPCRRLPRCRLFGYASRYAAGCPACASSGPAGVRLGLPLAFHPPVCRWRVPGSPRFILPPVSPVERTSGLPRLFLSTCGAAVFACSGCPRPAPVQRGRKLIFELPRISASRPAAFASSSCLDSAPAAGSVMSPMLAANFASAACAVDESSRSIRSRNAFLVRDAFLILVRLSAAVAGCEPPFQFHSCVRCLPRIAVRLPAGPSLD